jgi:hypothetical protein
VPEGLRKRRKTSESKYVSGPITDSRNSGIQSRNATDSTATFNGKVPMLASYQTLSSEIKSLHVSYVSTQLQRRHADIYTSVQEESGRAGIQQKA